MLLRTRLLLALRAALLAVAALLQAPLLLTVAMLFAPAAVAATFSAARLVRTAIAPGLLLAARLLAPRLRGRLCDRLRRRLRLRRRGRLEDAEDARQKAFRRACHGLHHLLRGLLRGRDRLSHPRSVGHDRGGLGGRDALHHGLLPLAPAFLLGARGLGLLRLLDHLVARRHVLHLVQLVVAQALHLVVRRLEVRVRHHHDVDLEARLELLDLAALLVQQEGGDVDRHLAVHGAGVFLHRLFLHDPQHVQRGRFGAADEAGAAAARAVDVRGLLERGLQPLARKLHQAEARDLADLHARAVVAQRIAQAVLHVALVPLRLHVDEVDDDEAAQVAQPQLPGHLVGGLEVRAQRGLLDVAAARGAGAS